MYMEDPIVMRSPETAYLASDEEFDRQLEELGWSPSDMVTMTGMYLSLIHIWIGVSVER